MSDNLKLIGMFENGYGVIPKKLMQMKLKELGFKNGAYVKMVLSYMLSYTGAGNTCFPSVDKMAEDLEVSRATIMKAIKTAVELGLVVKEKLYPDNRLKNANKYVLPFVGKQSQSRRPRKAISDTSEVSQIDSNNNSINNNNIKRDALPKKEEINPHIGKRFWKPFNNVFLSKDEESRVWGKIEERWNVKRESSEARVKFFRMLEALHQWFDDNPKEIAKRKDHSNTLIKWPMKEANKPMGPEWDRSYLKYGGGK